MATLSPAATVSTIVEKTFSTTAAVPTLCRSYSDLGYIQDGCVFAVDEIQFSRGASEFHVMASSAGAGGVLEIHLGSPTGPVVGKCDIAGTENWADYQEFNCKVAGCEGMQDVYFFISAVLRSGAAGTAR